MDLDTPTYFRIGLGLFDSSHSFEHPSRNIKSISQLTFNLGIKDHCSIKKNIIICYMMQGKSSQIQSFEDLIFTRVHAELLIFSAVQLCL